MVRQFITETIRKDREQVLAAADFPNFFEQLKEAASAEYSPTDPTSARTELRDLLVDKLQDDEFKLALIQLAKQKWYPALDAFYRRQSS
jgi:hypothetical protein